MASLLHSLTIGNLTAFEAMQSTIKWLLDPVSRLLLSLAVPEFSVFSGDAKREDLKSLSIPNLRKKFIDGWHTVIDVITDDFGIVVFLDDFQVRAGRRLTFLAVL